MVTAMNGQHILVVGAGSVGRRHLRNFAAGGCRTSAVDARADRLEEAAGEMDLSFRSTSLEAAWESGEIFDGVVISSPPKFHVDQALAAMERGLPVLLEKPVSPDLASAERLAVEQERLGVPLLLGYTYRWWPPLREVRRMLREEVVGTILAVRCVMSAHLADWHPWERYQDFFMASRDLGGGALLDESHFVDLLYWLFGLPDRVFANVEKLSGLEIETDDNVDAWLGYESGLRVNIHLDLYGRPHEKYMSFVGEKGTVVWSFDPNRIRVGRSAEQIWEDREFDHERNAMFVEVAREFLQVVVGAASPSCTAQDGKEVMRILEAMRASSSSGRVQAVGA